MSALYEPNLPLLQTLRQTQSRDQLEETLRIRPQKLGHLLLRARLEGLIRETPTGKVRLTKKGRKLCR